MNTEDGGRLKFRHRLKVRWMRREAGVEEGKTSSAQTSTVYWTHLPLMFRNLFWIHLISSLLPGSVYRCVKRVWGRAQRPEEGLRKPDAGVRGSRQPPSVNFVSLQKQQALSTAELTCPAPKALTR